MTLSSIVQQTAGGSSLLLALLWTAVFLHIGGGSVAILSGSVAITVRKGEHLHRLFGTIFFTSMLSMAGAAIFVALLVPERPNVLAGAFAFYLVSSAWLTVRRKEASVGLFERCALLLAACISASGLIFGVQAMTTESMPHHPFSSSLPSSQHWLRFSISRSSVAGEFRARRALHAMPGACASGFS